MIAEKTEEAVRPPDALRQRRKERDRLLTQLVYETDASGKPIYYKGYQDALSGTVEPTDLMGASALQSYLVNVLLDFLYGLPNKKQYTYLMNEIGVQIGKKKWRSCDIAIYRRDRLKDYTFTNKYIDVAPDYVVEIDTKADLDRYHYQHDYFIEKTRQLHEFGVKRVIWIFTENQPVIWESSTADTITIHQGWAIDLTLADGITFNLASLIEADKNATAA